jgi:hypothetical protein
VRKQVRAYLRATVKRGREQEVVLAEPARSVAPEVELGEYGEQEGREDGGVDPDGQVAERPCGETNNQVEFVKLKERGRRTAKNGRDDVVGAEFGEEPVRDPERNGYSETDQDGEWDNLWKGIIDFVSESTEFTHSVSTRWRIQDIAKCTPGNGIGIERLQ